MYILIVIFHIFGMFSLAIEIGFDTWQDSFEVCNVVNELTGILLFVSSAFVCIMRMYILFFRLLVPDGNINTLIA